MKHELGRIDESPINSYDRVEVYMSVTHNKDQVSFTFKRRKTVQSGLMLSREAVDQLNQLAFYEPSDVVIIAYLLPGEDPARFNYTLPVL